MCGCVRLAWTPSQEGPSNSLNLMSTYMLERTTELLATGKRARATDDDLVRHLASVVRKSRQATPPDAADAILAAIESGGQPPSRAKFRGPDFEDVGDDSFQGIEYAEGLCYERLLESRKGQKIVAALRRCRPNDDDEAHFSGPDGELIRALADGDCEPRIEVKRAVDPFNPVALLSPRAEDALCAVAARGRDYLYRRAHHRVRRRSGDGRRRRRGGSQLVPLRAGRRRAEGARLCERHDPARRRVQKRQRGEVRLRVLLL